MPSSDQASPGLPAPVAPASLHGGQSRCNGPSISPSLPPHSACGLQNYDKRLVPSPLRPRAAGIEIKHRFSRSGKLRTADLGARVKVNDQ